MGAGENMLRTKMKKRKGNRERAVYSAAQLQPRCACSLHHVTVAAPCSHSCHMCSPQCPPFYTHIVIVPVYNCTAVKRQRDQEFEAILSYTWHLRPSKQYRPCPTGKHKKQIKTTSRSLIWFHLAKYSVIVASASQCFHLSSVLLLKFSASLSGYP